MARGFPGESKERFWRRLLQEWRQSGQSVRAFCSAQAVSEPSFYAWRRRLTQRDQQQATTRRPARKHPAEATDQRPSTGLFAPVRLIHAAAPSARGHGADTASPSLEVLCRGGRIVRVAAGFDPAAVRALVAALEELPC